MVSNGVGVTWLNSYRFHRFQIWLYWCLCRLSRSKLCQVLVYLESPLSRRQNALCCRSDAYIFHIEYMLHYSSQIWQIMILFHTLHNGKIFLLKYLVFISSVYLCWNICQLLHIDYLQPTHSAFRNFQRDASLILYFLFQSLLTQLYQISFSIHSCDITALHHVSVNCVYS